ncbi:MAG: DNA primase [Candidatus Uhrbacteria bacterium]|nr:DNA primase [Candidatus Uhrbacteria bacterium]
MDPKDEIKQKIDILDLVSEYVALKPSGSTGFKGLCPFHSEKSPSFHVSQDRQNWHCFGCNEGGDCFSFVMKMEGMTFPEALMHLGKKVGVEVRRLPTAETNTRSRMLQVNDLAQKFYRKVLLDSTKAAVARSYVETRRIPAELEETFGLGFAPDDWDILAQFLLKRGFSETELVQAGVSCQRKQGSGVIDRFRNRLMIPLRDHHGNTVGFTGRSLPGDDHGSKYMNSPETPVYSKTHLVFGLDLAKQAAREAGAIVIVEGNLDVVASHKAGVANIVASSGTALTQEQLELIKRYTTTIVFAFDSDAAGLKAAKKGMSLARTLEFDIRTAILPEGVKDPDELVQKDPELWKHLVEHSEPMMKFFLSHVTRGKDLKNIDDKRAIARELLPALGEMPSVVEREHWLQVVADLLQIPVDQLRPSIPSSKLSVPATPSKSSTSPTPLSKSEKARRLLLGYLVKTPEAFDTFHKRLEKAFGGQELWITLYKFAADTYDSASQPAQKPFFSRMKDLTDNHPSQALLCEMLDTSMFMADETFQDLPPQKVLEHIDHLFTLLDEEVTAQQRSTLARELRQAEAVGDAQAVIQLLSQLND